MGSPVKFRGVTIGNVQSITIAPDHLHVEVWMRLYKDELARMGFGPDDKRDPSLRPQLAAAGITGVKFVQFDNFPPDRYPEPLLEFAPPSDYYSPAVQSTLKSLELLNGPGGESGRAGLLQRFQHYTGDPGYLPKWVEQIEKVSAADVQRVLREHMAAAKRVTVVTQPRPPKSAPAASAPAAPAAPEKKP